jgi:hypothetical protein
VREHFEEINFVGDDLGEQMAQLESENFAVYSNIEFLYLIGKYAA